MKSCILLKWRGIYLAVLGQVEGGDLLRLLDLLLVRLDLGLQLGRQLGHELVVLLVLRDCERHLLAVPLGLAVRLRVLPSVSLHVAQLHLDLVFCFDL